MKLNMTQKEFLFEKIFQNNSREIYKIFDTTSVNYLKKQKIELKEPDKFGWRPLLVNGEEYTTLNFDCYKEWEAILCL